MHGPHTHMLHVQLQHRRGCYLCLCPPTQPCHGIVTSATYVNVNVSNLLAIFMLTLYM